MSNFLGSELLVIEYFPQDEHNSSLFGMNLNDPLFLSLLKKDINLKNNKDYDLVIPPSGYISIALHVRRGGGPFDPTSFYDSQNFSIANLMDSQHPLKFPPLILYFEKLRRLLTSHSKKYFVYIFTDAPDIVNIVNIFKKEFEGFNNVIFESRNKFCGYDDNVLEDFFSMIGFDYIVRGDSNYSKLAEILKNKFTI